MLVTPDQIIDAIKSFIKTHGYEPTMIQIRQELNLDATTFILYPMKQLLHDGRLGTIPRSERNPTRYYINKKV